MNVKTILKQTAETFRNIFKKDIPSPVPQKEMVKTPPVPPKLFTTQVRRRRETLLAKPNLLYVHDIETIEKMFSQDEHLPVLVDIMENAVKLATNGDSDEENIRRLGQGWVAEEALAIAVYCSLRYENDFSAGIIAAVNHDGDSDSTGAIAGNILGACLGFEAIEDKWKHDLELSDLILEIADDLCFGCPMEEYGTLEDPVWDVKYRRIGTKLAFDGFEEA